MRKLLVTLDDELDNWLSGHINQTEVIREALRVYKGDIKTPTLDGIKQAFNQSQRNTAIIKDYLKEIDSKLDYIASRLEEQ